MRNRRPWPGFRLSRWTRTMQPECNPDTPQKLSSEREPRAPLSDRVERFEKQQQELWRLTFLLLFLVSAVFAWMSWGWLRTAGLHLEALPIGLVVLVALLSDQQLQQLFAMISKSQQGFRDLIDSFDDILLAMSLEGEIRAANRSFADLVGRPFQEIIGCQLTEFFEGVDGHPIEVLETGKARFLERRIWNGVVQMRLKKRNAVYFFECVAHAMVRDNEVHGL